MTLVTTETSLWVRPMPLSRMPPRAVSVTASCDLLVGQHPAGARWGRSSRRPRPARRRRRCRRCSTSRRAGRASRAMCATIREVVVLPLVPVTATTGTRGRSVVGPGPRLGRAHRRGGLADQRPRGPASSSASRTLRDRAAERLGPVAVAPRVARPRRWCTSLVGRTRTAEPGGPGLARRSGAPAAPTARAANRCRKPLPGSPGRALLQPDARRRTAGRTSLGGVDQRR